MPVAIVSRIAVVGRRNIEASMEVTPVMEEGPVVGVTVSVAITAAIEHGLHENRHPERRAHRAETATVDRHPTAPEPAAAKRRAAASKSAAVKPATAKATASTAAKPAATTATAAVPGLRSSAHRLRISQTEPCRDLQVTTPQRAVVSAASANTAAAVTPRQRTRPRPASDIAIDESSLTGDALRAAAAGPRRIRFAVPL